MYTIDYWKQRAEDLEKQNAWLAQRVIDLETEEERLDAQIAQYKVILDKAKRIARMNLKQLNNILG